MSWASIARIVGVGIGGTTYQKFGVVEDYWKATASASIDKGRIDVTQNPDDLYLFRVPSLRNVAMTAPYFHDGSVVALLDAVRVMARVQLGVKRVTPDAVQQWKQERGYDKPLLFNARSEGVGKLSETIFFEKSVKLFAFQFGF